MLNQPFFNQIETLSKDSRHRLEQTPVIQKCLAGESEMQSYIAFLTEAYHHVKHTVPLLMACGSRVPERLEWLREAIVVYIEEELGHQEWILNDLRHLGVDTEQIRCGQPSLATELMVSYAYDTVCRGNPLGFFGMVYTLEKTSSTIATLAAQKISTGLHLNSEAMSYMISHGSLDIEHIQHFEKLMNRLESEADRSAVLHSVPIFYKLYTDVFLGLPTSVSDGGEISHAA